MFVTTFGNTAVVFVTNIIEGEYRSTDRNANKIRFRNAYVNSGVSILTDFRLAIEAAKTGIRLALPLETQSTPMDADRCCYY